MVAWAPNWLGVPVTRSLSLFGTLKSGVLDPLNVYVFVYFSFPFFPPSSGRRGPFFFCAGRSFRPCLRPKEVKCIRSQGDDRDRVRVFGVLVLDLSSTICKPVGQFNLARAHDVRQLYISTPMPHQLVLF